MRSERLPALSHGLAHSTFGEQYGSCLPPSLPPGPLLPAPSLPHCLTGRRWRTRGGSTRPVQPCQNPTINLACLPSTPSFPLPPSRFFPDVYEQKQEEAGNTSPYCTFNSQTLQLFTSRWAAAVPGRLPFGSGEAERGRAGLYLGTACQHHMQGALSECLCSLPM